MVSPTTTATTLGASSADGVSANALYGRVSQSLVAQSASVQKLGATIERDQARLSGLGQLQGALADFQAFAESVKGSGLQTAATASAPTVLTAITNGNAKAGTHRVEVKQLAQRQVLSARAQSRQDGAIGGGAATTVKIELGTVSGSNFAAKSSKTVTIDAGNNSLQGIAKTLSAAGLDAQVVKSGNTYTLQLAGAEGGANSLRISVGGDAALQKLLSYNPAGVKELSQSSAAQDALLSVDGKQLASASNVITGAIAGTALALTGKGGTDVVVGQDPGAIGKNVANFVAGYNKLAARLDVLKQGELKGDGVLGQAQDQLSQLLKGAGAALAKVGVTFDRSGQLQVDAKTLDAAVAADGAGVAKLFTDGGKGVADQLSAKIGQLLGADARISARGSVTRKEIASLTAQQGSLTKALNAQASAQAAQYSQVGQGAGTGAALPGYTGPSSLFDFLA